MPVPLIWLDDNKNYEVGVPTYNVRVIDPADFAAKHALRVFINAIESCRQDFLVTSHSMLIFNNNRLLHGRTSFTGDRLILRTYVRPNLDALRLQNAFHR